MKQEKNTILTRKWKFPKIVLLIFLVFFLILIIQYAYLSLSPKVYGDDLRKYAEDRMTVEEVLLAKRGTIYDKEGNVLALNVTSYTLIAYLDPTRTKDIENPKHVVDIDATAEALAPILGVDKEYLVSRLSKKDVYQVEFGTAGSKLTELTKLEIESLNLPGLDFIESNKRYYPNGTFSSYIVGYAKKNEAGDIIGELGIESKYNDLLNGTNGYLMYQKDPSNIKIPDTLEVRVDAIDGSDIYLTIDSSIQRFAESAVSETVENYEPEWMLLTVMDAKTGEILASATSPNFDPNNLPANMSYQNPIISYEYEPGSTMKTYTYMCAMEKGNYDGDKTYLSGSYKVGPNTISDWNPLGWGNISYDIGFEYSSNVGIINIINDYLTPNELKDCLKSYGFGSKTGIELSGEASGNIEFNESIAIDSLTVGYGQGISTTAIQHLQALSIIANDGYMVKPHIISKIVKNDGTEIVIEPQVSSKPIVSESTVLKIKELMYLTVTDEWATGHSYYIEGYDIIGKTGTAEIFENGQYLQGNHNYLISFAGMYPKDDPEIIIYAAMKKPSINSSYALAVGVKELILNTSKYLNIFSDVKIEYENKIIDVDSYINKNISTVEASLNDKGLNVIKIGNGNTIIDQFPYVGSKLSTGDKIFLLTNGNEINMPSMFEWSRNEVQTYASLTNLKVVFEGNGYVFEQSIEEGILIDKGMELNLKLNDKYINVNEE